MLANFIPNFNPANVMFRANSTAEKFSRNYPEFLPKADTFERQKPAIPNKGQVLTADEEIFNRHDTSLCRTDIGWCDLAEYLDDRFKDQKHVNTYQYAASFGKEAYSLAMTLDKELGKTSEKFFPINAKDLSSQVIERNKKDQATGKILVTHDDTEHFYAALRFAYCPSKYDDYIDENDGKYYIKNDLINNVKFSQANILEDLDAIDSNTPSLVMCRNMWPYVDDSEYQDFANKLYEKLAPGSCVILGDFDYKKIGYPKNFPEALLEAGFEPSNAEINDYRELIFEKN